MAHSRVKASYRSRVARAVDSPAFLASCALAAVCCGLGKVSDERQANRGDATLDVDASVESEPDGRRMRVSGERSTRLDTSSNPNVGASSAPDTRAALSVGTPVGDALDAAVVTDAFPPNRPIVSLPSDSDAGVSSTEVTSGIEEGGSTESRTTSTLSFGHESNSTTHVTSSSQSPTDSSWSVASGGGTTTQASSSPETTAAATSVTQVITTADKISGAPSSSTTDDGKWPPPGNAGGNCAIPAEARLEDVSEPDTVVGTGTPSSCTGTLLSPRLRTAALSRSIVDPNRSSSPWIDRLRCSTIQMPS
jgi:hypothetical protein